MSERIKMRVSSIGPLGEVFFTMVYLNCTIAESGDCRVELKFVNSKFKLRFLKIENLSEILIHVES